jgi:hypothetical protein
MNPESNPQNLPESLKPQALFSKDMPTESHNEQPTPDALQNIPKEKISSIINALEMPELSPKELISRALQSLEKALAEGDTRERNSHIGDAINTLRLAMDEINDNKEVENTDEIPRIESLLKRADNLANKG